MTDSNLFGQRDLPAELQAFLGAVTAFRYPTQGCTSQVAIVVSERGQFVVKRALGGQWCTWLAREERVLRALATSGLPVPRTHLFLPPRDLPEAWLLMDFLPGETMERALAGEPDAAKRASLLRSFGQTLRAIQQTSPPPELVRPDRFWLDAMLDEAADNLAHYPVDGSPALLDWLRQHHPPAVPPTLIHGDYTLDNVLVQDGQVTGIIDWSNGGLGDPRYDLALATRSDDRIFESPADWQSFTAGYGGELPSDEI